MKRRRSASVVAAGTALFAAAVLTGCGDDEPEPDYQGVCVDEHTQQRVDDDECDDDEDSSGSHSFVYFGSGSRVPAVGQPYTGYAGFTKSVPNGHAAVRGGAPAGGGTVSKSTITNATRGGSGVTSRGAGSVGG